MKTKPTAGEWYLARQGKEIKGEGGHEVIAIINEIPVTICEIPIEQECSTSNPGGEDPTYHVSKRESIANGRLLAAALEMARALELIMEVSARNDYDTYRQTVREIAAGALVKAGR